MNTDRPWRDLYTDSIHESNVIIMGIPFDGAVSAGKGTSFAPDKIRDISRNIPACTENGEMINNIKIFDAGNIKIDLNWTRYFESVEQKALELLKNNKTTIFLGGDHSVTIPLHLAFNKYCKLVNKNKIGVIHFDSHADLCNEYDGSNWSHACTERRAVEDIILPENLACLGLRSWEEEEIEYITKHPEIMLIKASDVFKNGYLECFQKLEEKFKNYDSIYLTLDIDVVDPGFAPGTGTQEAGGITSREFIELVKLLIEKLPITVIDIVEVSPPLDDINNTTSKLALKIIYEILGTINHRRA